MSHEIPNRPAEDAPQGKSIDEITVLAGLPHACFVVDNEWRLTYANHDAEQMLKQLCNEPLSALMGKDLRKECPELADSTFTRECIDALAQQKSLEMETFYPALHRWFAVRVFPSGNRQAVFLQDITQRTLLQRNVTRKSDELIEADRGKDSFLVELAHEVRNAMAPMRNALHLINTRGPGEDTRRACGLADEEVRRLSRLMEDLTKLSHSEALPSAKERINVSKVVAQALTDTLMSPSVAGRKITCQLAAEPLWIEAYPGHIEQALRHVLDNAVKFTGPEGSIRVSAEREGTEIVIRVRDDGMGVTEHVMPHVFNLFMRRPSTDSARFHIGLGVGLTLVRKLVLLHAGSVEARSDGPGQGSEFTIRWPALSAVPVPAAAPPPSAPVGDQGLDVLVVDDSVDTAQSLALLLSGWGCQVRVAYDGPGALDTVRARQPDLVIMDIGMPGMNGHQVAERLRNDVNGDSLTLVALTGYGRDEDRSRALEAGFDYHMIKPVDPTDLKDLIMYMESSLRREDVG